MAACSFKARVGGPCSYDSRDQSKSVNEVLFLSCVKDIERHRSPWAFTGVTVEQELILLIAYFFTTQLDVSHLYASDFPFQNFCKLRQNLTFLSFIGISIIT